jgi:hypothetical protein
MEPPFKENLGLASVITSVKVRLADIHFALKFNSLGVLLIARFECFEIKFHLFLFSKCLGMAIKESAGISGSV